MAWGRGWKQPTSNQNETTASQPITWSPCRGRESQQGKENLLWGLLSFYFLLFLPSRRFLTALYFLFKINLNVHETESIRQLLSTKGSSFSCANERFPRDSRASVTSSAWFSSGFYVSPREQFRGAEKWVTVSFIYSLLVLICYCCLFIFQSSSHFRFFAQ